jgi:hypothetical protein
MLRISSALVGVVVALLFASAAHAQPAPLTAIEGALPDDLTERVSFEALLSVTGGTPPVTWSIVAGSLPDGVVLHSRTGLLHGTPSRRGEFRFTVQARDANNATITRAFELSISYKPTSPAGSKR